MHVSDYPKNPLSTQPEDSVSDTTWYANSSAPSDLGLGNSVEAGPCFQLATLVQAVDNDRALALELLELVLDQTPGVSVLIRHYAGMLRAELLLMELALQTATEGDLP